MSMALRLSLAVGLLTLVACDSLTFVEPQPEQPALNVHLDARIDEHARYTLDAFFRPGVDTRGRPTQVVDRALYVEGMAVLPGPERVPGHWSYRWQEERATTGDQRDSVRVTFPVIANTAQAHSTAIPVTARDGPANVDVTRGQDLVLRVSLPSGERSSPFGGVEFWTLDIRPSCSGSDTPQLTISGRHPFPAELRIPWAWLETQPAGSMAACLRAFSSYPVVGSPYLISVSVTIGIAWQVRLVAPAT